MSELPPLPDSDDPHELLGVPEDADEMQIKRAYLAKIRIYRPERAPAEFQRLHEAYNRALQYLTFSTWTWNDEAASDADEEPAADDALHAPLRDAWEALANGDREAAQRHMASARRERPHCVRTVAHQTLLAEALGAERSEATRDLGALLGQDAAVGTWLTSTFQPADVAVALTERPGRWARLSELPDRQAALRLLRRRWHTMLLAGRLGDVCDEALEPAFRAEAHDDPWLADAALEVMVAAVWEAPKPAEQLLAEYGHEAAHEDAGVSAEDHYHIIKLQGLDTAYRVAVQDRPIPAALAQWFQLWPILDTDERRRLAERILAELPNQPEAYLRAFDQLSSESEELVWRHVHSIEEAGVTRDAEIPLLQRARVKETLESLTEGLPRKRITQLRRRYGHARALFLRAVIVHALSPLHISWWLRTLEHRRADSSLARALYPRIGDLDGDMGIRGVYWTCRLQELLTETEVD